MTSSINRFRSFFTTLAVLIGLTLCIGLARASDRVHLKDGRVLEGTVAREVNGYIWLKFKVGDLETTQMFSPDEIARIERDASRADAAATAPDKAAPAAELSRPGVPRIAVISLGEGGGKNMVGIYFTADSLRRIIPLLEEEGITDVVFRINSGGGLALELQPLSDVIHNEYKFRKVAWIESAISAAAMTAHCMKEIYFMPQGNYGGCTMFRPDGQGGGTAAKGRELEDVLYQMEKISARGEHNTKIMRSMQIEVPLSCDIDEETGEVEWYNTLEGEYVVNPEKRVLTFNAVDAVKYKFAKGIASNIEELQKLMGYEEAVWVGKRVPGVPYPVCKAEQEIRNFRDRVYKDEQLTRTYFVEYQQAYQFAAGAPANERGKFIAKCRSALDKIKRMVSNNPNFSFLIFNRLPEDFKYWVEEREEELRRLGRR